MLPSRLRAVAHLVFLLACSASAGIYTFEHTKLGVGVYDFQYRWLRVGMFSSADAPERSWPGDGRSFIRFQAQITVDPSQMTPPDGYLNGFVFHSDHKISIGAIDEATENVQFCCTKSALEKGLCAKEDFGQVIYDRPNEDIEGSGPGEFQVFKLAFRTQFRDGVDWNFDVGKSGIYYLYVINCVADNTTGPVPLYIDGEPGATFMNPYGYLNGELYGFLPFFGTMCLVYIMFGIVWFILSVRHIRKLLKLQNMIAGVIGLGLVEMATLYFDSLGYNQHGVNYVGAMIAGVIVSTFKRTALRLLLLSASMGFSVVRPTLGAARNKVIVVGVIYCGISVLFNIAELVQRTAAVSPSLVLFLGILVGIFELAIGVWIFLSLNRLLSQLTSDNQMLKIALYKRFLWALIMTGLTAAVLILSQFTVTMATDPDETWRSQFIWISFWHLLSFVLLGSTAFIFRPNVLNNDSMTANGYTPVHVMLVKVDADHLPLPQPLSSNEAVAEQSALHEPVSAQAASAPTDLAGSGPPPMTVMPTARHLVQPSGHLQPVQPITWALPASAAVPEHTVPQ